MQDTDPRKSREQLAQEFREREYIRNTPGYEYEEPMAEDEFDDALLCEEEDDNSEEEDDT
jgi:hypothetical protein